MGIPARSFVLLILLALFRSPAAVAQDNVQIFTKPPDPQTLADLLFKPRYRSGNASDQTTLSKFGMMINFDYDSTRIVAESLPLLDSVAQMLTLEEAEGKVLVIEGHADAAGSDAYNQDLSERRAQAVKEYLIGSFAIPEHQLVTLGAGESDLHDTNDPYAAINRRVVFRPVRSIVLE